MIVRGVSGRGNVEYRDAESVVAGVGGEGHARKPKPLPVSPWGIVNVRVQTRVICVECGWVNRCICEGKEYG